MKSAPLGVSQIEENYQQYKYTPKTSPGAFKAGEGTPELSRVSSTPSSSPLSQQGLSATPSHSGFDEVRLPRFYLQHHHINSCD